MTTTTLTSLSDLRDALRAIEYDDETGTPTLESLHPALRENVVSHGDFSDLPTFGGEAPRDTRGIWSWDATHVLVGEGRDEWEIIRRAES